MGLGTEPATLNPFEAADKSSVRALSHVYGRVPTRDMRATPLNAQPTVTGGPFRFVQRTLGREIDLAANPGYYAGLPRVARVVERIYSTPQAELDALKHGRVSWLP